MGAGSLIFLSRAIKRGLKVQVYRPQSQVFGIQIGRTS